ncbi:hypothetical protein [Riemerella columbina]|uniref:hypothetical protein n=1 Tax=Riemerella columbina TaxID=103810 RepID=UPI002670132F|nr:hypothetical protein [Riemerella columbina]WKS95324.1 hypothetical protein NYR17_00880 [Riemerella columbina]
MKGILKIYHPEETLKYNIARTYCKSVLNNDAFFLEIEIITTEDTDYIEDDSLQYQFPQLALKVIDFPIKNKTLVGQTFHIDNDDEVYTEADLFDDEEAETTDNELSFSQDEEGGLQLMWKGEITDFYTQQEEPIPFKLKCHFREEQIEVED